METTYYSVPAQRVTVSAAAPAYEKAPVRELVCLRRQAPAHTGNGGQIIDFTAWKQAHTPQPAAPVRPVAHTAPRCSPFLTWLSHNGEWVATLSVIAAMLLLSLRILVA